MERAKEMTKQEAADSAAVSVVKLSTGARFIVAAI